MKKLALSFWLLASPAFAATGISISDLPNGGLLQQTDLVPMVRNGTTMKAQPFLWPPSGRVMVSNGTGAPAGIAPIDGYCLVGMSGTWAAAQCPYGSTVTVTGSPSGGNLTFFSGVNTITNGDLSGDCTTSGTSAVTCTKTNGVAFAASATTDTTDAGNISSGTLPAGRLPNPSPTTPGGIESLAAVSHRWINQISTLGVPSAMQPACSDLSDGATGCSTGTGTSGATIPLLNGNNTYSGTANFTGGFSIGGTAQTFPGSGLIVGTTDTQTLTNKSISGSEINSGTVANTYLPTATSAALGIVRPDNTTVTVSGGILSATGGSLITTGTANTLNPYAPNTSHAQAHGLGAAPTIVSAYLECLSAEDGYAVGDRVPLQVDQTNSQTNGVTIAYNATNTYINTSNASTPLVVGQGASAGSINNITASKWKLVIVPMLIQ